MNKTQQITISPRVDIFENDDAYLLLTDLPGVRAENVDLRYEKEHLELRVSNAENEVEYARRFKVQGIAEQKITAQLKEGVLRLELPKTSAVKPRQVVVRSA